MRIPGGRLRSYGGRVGRDGVPRLRPAVVADDDAGPRLCRVRDAVGEGDGGVLSAGLPVGEPASDADGQAADAAGVLRAAGASHVLRTKARTEAVTAGVRAGCPQCGAERTAGAGRLVSAACCPPVRRERARRTRHAQTDKE